MRIIIICVTLSGTTKHRAQMTPSLSASLSLPSLSPGRLQSGRVALLRGSVKDLTRNQTIAVVFAIVVFHVLLGWSMYRARVHSHPIPASTAPIFVDFITEKVPTTPQVVLKPVIDKPINKTVVQKPLPRQETPTVPTSPSSVAMPVLPVQPVATPLMQQVTSASVALPEPQPKIIPASAVQYVRVPTLVYPRASRHLGESGSVLVRVFIDESGVPQAEQVDKSSGYYRLDDAAIAAVRSARFKPYTENGRAVAGWALIPLNFDLEH